MPDREVLIAELVRRANGVFLWAALVVRSLIKGVRSGDEIETLHLRIQQTPKELSDLFQRMVEEVEEVHQESLAFYLEAMKALQGAPTQIRNICIFTAARLDERITSYKRFADVCRQTENQILAQSAGLLEVHSVEYDTISEELWLSASARFFSPALARGFSEDRRRERALASEKYPEMLGYEGLAVEWVHRSAFDFVFPSDGSQSPLAFAYPVDEEKVLRRLCRGYLNYFAIAPSIQRKLQFGGRSRLQSTTYERLMSSSQFY
jgi:hypothetical protein